MKTLAKRLASSMIAFTATLALAVAMSSPASAATTYTPGGGPNVNFVGSNVSFTFIQANQTWTCQTFNLAGSIASPGLSRAIGWNAANVGTLTSAGCSNVIMGPTTITPTGTWGMTVTGDALGSTWPVRITNVNATFSMNGCSFQIGGVANGTFDVATQRFTPVGPASGLKIVSTPAGFICPIIGVAKDQDIKIGGTWTNTPPAGSGPLTIAVP
ncbi:hypothetical protein [Aeromicrobium sp. Sec7.5]|uniref:hypothetical protein n=1 Tax=Aeromicrobium sp. Sec7.5 TaxID=3121276 RepID=UPI002FE43878